MGSANSVQHREAHQALKQKFKEVARIARLLEEDNVAKSLEILSESPDLSADPVLLNVRKGLIKASTPELGQNLAPHSGGLTEHFRQLGLNEVQIERLIPLTQAWERQKAVLVGIIEQAAPHWERNHGLFWGGHQQPHAPSTVKARAWRLVCGIEDTTVSAIRRRLLLVSICKAIETEADELSTKINRLHNIDQKLNKVARELSKERSHSDVRLRAQSDAVKRRRTEKAQELQRQEAILTEEQGRLNDEIRRYPEGKLKQRVKTKFLDDIPDINGLSEEERKKEEQRLSEHVRLGKRYCRFPLGVLAFMGKTYTKP
ncbi:MAG: hypothetical protein M1840_007603 [Geoglossum simile]|nr:MAG: hypothetical protein M1840_007603 [Geoglossum simile]